MKKKSQPRRERPNGRAQALPKGWRLARLGEIAEIFYSNVDKKTRAGEAATLLCNYTDVYSNNKIVQGMQFMRASATAREIKKFSLLKGDVVFTKDSEDPLEIGVPCLIADDIPNLVCGYHLGIARAKKGVSGKYICFVLQTDSAKKQFARIASGISRFGLGLSETKKTLFPFPPLAEQERIAEILSDVDSAIAMTEKELILVIARNKRLMLEFATSKSADWKTKRLSEIVVIKKGEQLNRENFLRDGNYPVYNGGVTHSGHYNRWNTEANTLTISEGGNAGYVRYVAERFWSGGHCYTLEAKDKKTDTKLVYFLLKAKEREVMRLRVGSALKNIQAGDLSAFTIQLPPRKMGVKISKALSVAEQEREKILSLIAALKRQKRGLMQQLLTGKIRVLPKNNKGGKK